MLQGGSSAIQSSGGGDEYKQLVDNLSRIPAITNFTETMSIATLGRTPQTLNPKVLSVFAASIHIRGVGNGGRDFASKQLLRTPQFLGLHLGSGVLLNLLAATPFAVLAFVKGGAGSLTRSTTSTSRISFRHC